MLINSLWRANQQHGFEIFSYVFARFSRDRRTRCAAVSNEPKMLVSKRSRQIIGTLLLVSMAAHYAPVSVNSSIESVDVRLPRVSELSSSVVDLNEGTTDEFA